MKRILHTEHSGVLVCFISRSNEAQWPHIRAAELQGTVRVPLPLSLTGGGCRDSKPKAKPQRSGPRCDELSDSMPETPPPNHLGRLPDVAAQLARQTGEPPEGQRPWGAWPWPLSLY